MDDDLETARKRVIFRSHHSGMKENNILIGAFADRYVPTMDADDLAWFEQLLLTTDDIDLHYWMVGRVAVPANLAEHPVMRLLTEFRLVP
ncbi:MAG: succinate dehydrogenase assembly factor 2 [Rhodospirillales bacterium]|jgi:antitoxin CptB|nr:succinate dehydrogenase assembly factor 2 [Rhodospirillales bacterium]